MISPITDIPQNCHIADWYIAHSDSDNDSGNTKKVVSIDNPRTDQGCNINMNRKANTGSITGDQIDCKAETLSVTITKDGNKPFASSAGEGAVEEAKGYLPCSAPLDGYQQEDPILVISLNNTVLALRIIKMPKVRLVARCHIYRAAPNNGLSYNFSVSPPFTRGQVPDSVIIINHICCGHQSNTALANNNQIDVEVQPGWSQFNYRVVFLTGPPLKITSFSQ